VERSGEWIGKIGWLTEMESIGRVYVCLAYVYVSFRCYSDEDLSKLGITSSSLSPMHAASSPLHAMLPSSSLQNTMSAHLSSRSAQDSTANSEAVDVNMASVLECIKTSRRMLQSQIDEVYELKVCVIV